MRRFLLQRTWSAFGTKRTSQCAQPMSAFGGKADIAQTSLECPLLTQSGHRVDCKSVDFGAGDFDDLGPLGRFIGDQLPKLDR